MRGMVDVQPVIGKGEPSGTSRFSPVDALRIIRLIFADPDLTNPGKLAVAAVALDANSRTGFAWTTYRSLCERYGISSASVAPAFRHAIGRYFVVDGRGRHGSVRLRMLAPAVGDGPLESDRGAKAVLYNALVALFNIAPSDARACRQADIVAAGLATRGASPADIALRLEHFRETWPTLKPTPHAILKHFDQLGSDSPREALAHDAEPSSAFAGEALKSPVTDDQTPPALSVDGPALSVPGSSTSARDAIRAPHTDATDIRAAHCAAASGVRIVSGLGIAPLGAGAGADTDATTATPTGRNGRHRTRRSTAAFEAPQSPEEFCRMLTPEQYAFGVASVIAHEVERGGDGMAEVYRKDHRGSPLGVLDAAVAQFYRARGGWTKWRKWPKAKRRGGCP